MDFTNEDAKIGKAQKDEFGTYKMINGKKIYQIEERTKDDKDTNDAINRWRASDTKSTWEYLNSK